MGHKNSVFNTHEAATKRVGAEMIEKKENLLPLRYNNPVRFSDPEGRFTNISNDSRIDKWNKKHRQRGELF